MNLIIDWRFLNHSWAAAMRLFILSSFCLALAGCGLDQTTYRADKPVSAAAASKRIAVPFPSSAKDVYYLFHAGGMQEMEMFVRFTVDPKDLDTAVTDILADHDKITREHHSYLSLPAPDAPRSHFAGVTPMPWWTPDAITNGYYRASTNGQPFYVWADLSQHTVYLCTHD